jgi:hypothetical protein
MGEQRLYTLNPGSNFGVHHSWGLLCLRIADTPQRSAQPE